MGGHWTQNQCTDMLHLNAYWQIKHMHKYTCTHIHTHVCTQHTHWHQGETRVRQDWLSLPVAPQSILIFPTLLFLHTSLSLARLLDSSLFLWNGPFIFFPCFLYLPCCPFLTPHFFFPNFSFTVMPPTLSIHPLLLPTFTICFSAVFQSLPVNFPVCRTRLTLTRSHSGESETHFDFWATTLQWTHLQGDMDTYVAAVRWSSFSRGTFQTPAIWI